MRQMVFVGKLINRKSEYVNNQKRNLSEKVLFKTSGIGANFEIREIVAPNGIKYKKYIPLT